MHWWGRAVPRDLELVPWWVGGLCTVLLPWRNCVQLCNSWLIVAYISGTGTKLIIRAKLWDRKSTEVKQGWLFICGRVCMCETIQYARLKNTSPIFVLLLKKYNKPISERRLPYITWSTHHKHVLEINISALCKYQCLVIHREIISCKM